MDVSEKTCDKDKVEILISDCFVSVLSQGCYKYCNKFEIFLKNINVSFPFIPFHGWVNFERILIRFFD